MLKIAILMVHLGIGYLASTVPAGSRFRHQTKRKPVRKYVSGRLSHFFHL